MVEKVEQTTEEPIPAKAVKAGAKKPVKKAKQPKRQKQPKPDDGLYLPVLAELAYTSVVIFLTLVFLAMAIVSWLTGASLLDFVLRTSVAMGVLGSLLLVFSRQVSAGVLSVSIAEIEKKRQESASEDHDQHEDLEQPEKTENEEAPKVSETSTIAEVR